MLLSVFTLAFLFLGTGAVPQFGGFGLKKIVPAALPVPGADSFVEWSTKIQDLIELTRSTLTDMGQIAVADNPVAGARIVSTLNEEIQKAVKIGVEFSAKALSTGRVRRASDGGAGAEAYNGVGQILVDSDGKIEGDKKELSPEAQKKIKSKHRKALKRCQADPCKSATLMLEQTDGEERQ